LKRAKARSNQSKGFARAKVTHSGDTGANRSSGVQEFSSDCGHPWKSSIRCGSILFEIDSSGVLQLLNSCNS
jgi:hypothetical protein